MVIRSVCLLTLTLGLMACQYEEDVRESPRVPNLNEVSSDNESFPLAEGRAERYYLSVAANPDKSDTDSYQLPVAIVRADPDVPKKPPVVYIGGGPGIGNLNAAAYPGAYPWVGDRDFIVFGQRGTHHAEPALLCDDFSAALSASEDVEDLVQAAKACRTGFDRDGIDLSNFHTQAIAADLEALRRAFGYETLTLYGLSYGTRVALTYARDYPDHVEAMVLDSVLPHTISYDDESPETVRRWFEKIAQACQTDAACRSKYPDLGPRFFAAIEAINKAPISVTDQNGQPRTVSAAELINLMPLTDASSAPPIMDALARMDMEPFLSNLDAPRGLSPFAWGMRLSVWCSEALPFSQRYEQTDLSGNFAGLDGATVSPDVCKAWDVPKRPASERVPTISDIPTLLLSGKYDVLTPPEWAESAAETLSRSMSVTIPNEYHSVTTNWGGDGCAMTIVAAFVQNPDSFLAAPDTACLDNAKPLLFNSESSQ